MPAVTYGSKGQILTIDGLEVISGPYETEEELLKELAQIAETRALRTQRPCICATRLASGKCYGVNTT